MIEEYRASKITIEVPKEHSEPWVHLTINKMFKDDEGNLTNEIPRFDYISKPLSQVATNMYEYLDPIQRQTFNISGYGLAQAITSYVDKHLKEKYADS